MSNSIHRYLLLTGVMLTLSCGGGTAPPFEAPSITTLPTTTPSAAPATHLGANLPMINDWSFTPVYVNLMHQARKFGSPTVPWDERAPLGADGWPTGDFGVVLMLGSSKYSGNAGRYHVSFNGRAKVMAVASSATVANLTYDAAQNRSSAEVLLPDGEDQLMLAFTETGDGIKNVRVIRPGYDPADPPLFTEPFLGHIARFKVLRFMDWLRTNNNPVTSWSTRASPQTTHFASHLGVPWEHIIALANQTLKDIWINIPIGADDEYVRQLALLLKASLNSDSKIYVEYSNEIWNGGFEQFAINRSAAVQEVMTNPASRLVYDGKADTTLLASRRVAKRLKEIGDVFRSVYGQDAVPNTIRPVLASQVVQPMTAKIGLEFIDAVYGPPSDFLYGIAGAPYFNLGSQQRAEDLSTDDVIKALGASVEELAVVNAFESNRALATWYKLKFLAYEGGPDTFGTGSLAAKKSANLDPRMRDLCVGYLTNWYRDGGDVMMWFMAGAGNWDTRYGAWELTTDLALTDTPKLRCLDSVLAAPVPAPRARHEVPGTFDALAFVGNRKPYSAASVSRLRYLQPGSFLDYLILAPATATYTLIIRAQAALPGNTIEVAVNSRVVAPGLELVPAGWGTPVDNAPVSLHLAKGFNTVRLTTRTENLGYLMSTLTIR